MVGLGGLGQPRAGAIFMLQSWSLESSISALSSPQLRGGNRVNGSALSFLRPIVPKDSRSSSPAYFRIPPFLESPQAVGAHVAPSRFPFEEVHLQSRDARARVGRLAVHWT